MAELFDLRVTISLRCLSVVGNPFWASCLFFFFSIEALIGFDLLQSAFIPSIGHWSKDFWQIMGLLWKCWSANKWAGASAFSLQQKGRSATIISWWPDRADHPSGSVSRSPYSLDYTQKLTRSTLALKLSVSPPYYPWVTATVIQVSSL